MFNLNQLRNAVRTFLVLVVLGVIALACLSAILPSPAAPDTASPGVFVDLSGYEIIQADMFLLCAPDSTKTRVNCIPIPPGSFLIVPRPIEVPYHKPD